MIGVLTGFLVAKLGMPSFVVTLALFIAWQGVILQLIGDGGTLGLRDPVLVAVANGNMSTRAAGCCSSSPRAATRRCCSSGRSGGASSGWSPSPPAWC